MVDLDKIGIEEILKDTVLLLSEHDIFYYCTDDEMAKGIYNEIENKNRMASMQEAREILRTLKKAEPFIDKEKFIKCLLRNYANYYNNLLEKVEGKVIEALKIATGKKNIELTDKQIDKIMRDLEKCKDSSQVFEKIISSYCKQKGENVQECKTRVARALTSGNAKDVLEISEDIYKSTEMGDRIDFSTKKMESYLKGRNSLLPSYYYDEEEEKFGVEVMIPNALKSEYKEGKENLKRIKKITTYYGEGIDGVAFIMQATVLNDLEQIFSDQEFGQMLRMMIIDNVALKRGIPHEEISRLKKEDPDGYCEKIEGLEWNLDFIAETAETIRRYAEFADIDKMLLISAYRFNRHLETGGILPEKVDDIKKLLKGIYENIDDKTQGISCELNMEKDAENGIDFVHVEYSPEDLKKCLANFTTHDYVTQKQREEYREQIENSEIEFIDIDPEKISLIFTKEEQERLSLLSDNNLFVIAAINDWPQEKIVEFITKKNGCSTATLKEFIDNKALELDDLKKLYLSGVIDLQIFDEIEKEEADNLIGADELVDLYKETTLENVSDEEMKENKEKYDRYVNLYKSILSKEDDKEKESKENELIACVFDKIDDERKLEEALAELYSNGLLKIDTIIDWYGQDIVDILYNKSAITLDDIKVLVANGKVPIEFISEKYAILIKNKEMDYDERLKYIRSGFVDEKDIINLFKENLIFENDLKKLTEEGFVTEEEKDRAINNRTMQELESKSSIKLTKLDDLKKIGSDIYDEDGENGEKGFNPQDKRPKRLIDPNIREDYIRMFNAYSATALIEEDSPFYNYEFYVIPDETGELGANSIVIAERYYENKDTKYEFALGNATYFFRYKDLMVLSNLKKSEMDKERENIVFRSNHNMNTEKKAGSWATSVIYSVVKTMMSSDLKEYSRENQRKIIIDKLIKVYGHEKLSEILDLAGRIDDGEFDYEITDTGTTKKSKKKKSDNKETKSDDEGFELDD